MPERRKAFPINPGEAKVLKVTIDRLSELAAKQALYGIVQTLTLMNTLRRKTFEEILDDARKLSEITGPRGL
jgi:hypothetical protein